MAGRTPIEALDTYIDPMREALQCITRERLICRERSRLTVDTPHAVSLRNMDPIPLRAQMPLLFTAGQHIRIVETAVEDETGPFNVSTIRYFYEFATRDRTEILSFHWTPEAHVPTGHVSLEAVIRFAIIELGVQPLRDGWQSILERTEDAFLGWRTR